MEVERESQIDGCSFPGKRRGTFIAGGWAPQGRSRGCNPAWAGSLTIAGSQLTKRGEARRGENKTEKGETQRERSLAAHCWQQTLGLLFAVHPPSPLPSSHSSLAPRHPSDAPTTHTTAPPSAEANVASDSSLHSNK